MPDRVRITDVSPRDGLQNEPGVIPTADKVRLIEHLCRTGVDEIEATSFVSPKWVPQLGDARAVLEQVTQSLRENWTDPKLPGVPCLSVLVPNARGMEDVYKFHAEVATVEKVAVFTAASETFSQRNTNASIAETLERFKPVIEMAKHACGKPIAVRGYLSCVIACPFEGSIAPETIAVISKQLIDLGIDELDLGDTIGAGTPETVHAMLKTVVKQIGSHWLHRDRLTLHLHDTFGRAADCVKAALDLGVRSFDGSVAGLGGCPYASTPGKRAPGNIATELLVRTIHESGYTTGVDLDALAEAAAFARKIVAASRAPSGGAT